MEVVEETAVLEALTALGIIVVLTEAWVSVTTGATPAAEVTVVATTAPEVALAGPSQSLFAIFLSVYWGPPYNKHIG